jgi:hypothetical protein
VSDLRERLIEAGTDDRVSFSRLVVESIVDDIWPIIEAALQKRDRLRDQINDAYVRTETALNEANKLIEQTIEVLEGLRVMEESSFSKLATEADRNHWYHAKAKPLLDNLKARKP